MRGQVGGLRWVEGSNDDRRRGGDLILSGELVGEFGAEGAPNHEVGHGTERVQLGRGCGLQPSLLLCISYGHDRDGFQFTAEADRTLHGGVHNGRILAYRELAATPDRWIHVQVAQLLEVRDAE